MTGLNLTRRRLAGVASFARAGLLLATLVVLAACSAFGLSTPHALTPIMDAEHVESAMSDRQRLMAALGADMHFSPNSSSDWYEVVETGFSIVDDECKVYFSELFTFDRSVKATRSTLNVFQTFTNAILAVTGADTITMTTIAQAFGLASSMTDVVADTYLYRLPPAPTKEFVFKMLRAYDNESSLNRSAITGPESAYRRIQGYLDLCLPVTIESNLLEHVNDAVATANSGKGGSALEVRVGSNNSALVLSELIEDSKKPLPSAGKNSGTGQGPSEYERSVPSYVWMDIQNALCIGKDGLPGPGTHEAMAAFFEGMGRPDTNIVSKGIGPYHMSYLTQAIDDAQGRSCQEMGYSDAKSVGKVYSSGVTAGQ